MLYFIGNQRHAEQAKHLLPTLVGEELFTISSILDRSYGEERNFLRTGGYSIIVDDSRDLPSLVTIVNFRYHPIEWVKKLDDYVVSLYLLGDDFSIVLFLPFDITPTEILKELEKEENMK